jgi:hypothetical protein
MIYQAMICEEMIYEALIGRAIRAASVVANCEDVLGMPCPSRLCIALWPKRPGLPLFKIPVSCR